MSPTHTTFAPHHLYSLEDLKCHTLWPIPGMYLRTFDSARDISNDQWVASVPFYYSFDVSFGFLQMPLGDVLVSQARVIWTIDKET